MGLPSLAYLNLRLLRHRRELNISKATSSINDITVLIIGCEVSVIGVAAISEMSIVITNSPGCNCPNCRLPISRTHRLTKQYIINVLIIVAIIKSP